MQRLDTREYEQLTDGAEVIATDWHGVKVLRRRDGSMLKVFRPKGGVTTALVRPYACRFERASRRLVAAGVPTVHVTGVYRVPGIERDVARFDPLEGVSLRDELAARPGRVELLRRFAAFVASLHARGVYFRGLHFDNVIVTPDERFGLIDVADTRVFARGLGPWRRARNFRPLLHDSTDVDHLVDVGLETFLRWYLEEATLSTTSRRAFLVALGVVDARFRAACGGLTRTLTRGDQVHGSSGAS